MSSYFYDRQGAQISLFEWANLMEDPAYTFVGFSTIGTTGLFIATYWRGIEPAEMTVFHPERNRPHLIYETCAFRLDPPRPVQSDDGDIYRWWVNEQSALTGHRQVCEWVRDHVAGEGEIVDAGCLAEAVKMQQAAQ